MGSDYKELKEIIELREYLDTLGVDRPRLSEILKTLAIDPKTMWNCVVAAAGAASIVVPDAQIAIMNDMFKLGVTVGYKYQVTKSMDKEFGFNNNSGNGTPESS